MQYKTRIAPLLLLFSSVLLLDSCATSRLSRSGQQKIAGKTIVIIGASSGFGRGVAERLGDYKANVVLAARRTEVLEEVAGVVRKNGGTALVMTTDITKPDQVQALAEAAVAKYGHIDVWINDAGVGAIGRFGEIPLEDHARLIDVNYKGVVYGSHFAIRQFKAQGYGTLINLGSVESHVPLAYHASYAGTKAAIRNLDQAINQELRLSGHKKTIRVVTIEPWATDTPFWTHAANYSGHAGRMAAMDGPDKVVNAIIWSSLHRKKEIPTGWKAKASVASHRIAPRFTEWFSAQVVHRYQMKIGAPTPLTSGSVHKPMESGTGIEDGVRAKQKAEKKAFRKSKH